jgi:lactate racemase
MSHPCLVTLDSKSVPRVLFAGDSLVEMALPPGARVLYPRRRQERSNASPAELTRLALERPLGAEPLGSRLRSGMRVTIVLDGVFLPGHPAPDVRVAVLDVLLAMLSASGVDDLAVVVAGGVDRRRTGLELRRLVGARVFKALWPRRVYTHDPEAPGSLVRVGNAGDGAPLQLARRVVESDLVIQVRVRGGQMGGFGGPLLRGTGSAAYYLSCALAGHLSSPAPEEIEAFARLPNFAVEVLLGGPYFRPSCEFLASNEDELTPGQVGMLRTLRAATSRLPQIARRKLLDGLTDAPEVTAIVAGDPDVVSRHAEHLHLEQTRVPVRGQADVLVTGVPHASAHNVGTSMNPLLVAAFAQGYLFNLYQGAPLVKEHGTLVIAHPCTDRFDRQHASYASFFHQAIHQTHDKHELAAYYRREFASNPGLLQMFRNGDACHPVHPFLSWMAGEAARQHLGRVIVVGADNEYIPHMLGFETAPNLAQALYRARDGADTPQEILCLHSPMTSIGDVG